MVAMALPAVRIRLVALAVTAAVLTAPVATASTDNARGTDDVGAVDTLLHKRLANPRLGSHVGMLVVDARTGADVSAQAADQLLRPASNLKIVTAVAVLARVGADTALRTTVRQGATATDVVLEGGGDPLLTTRDLRQLAARVAKRIPTGTPVTVHVDDDLFARTGRAPGWTGSYLGAEAARVDALARFGDYSRDPSGNAAAVFAAALTSRGLPASIGPAVDAGAGPVLARTPGHTVAQAVAVMLSRSENNVAEVLFRQVAVATGVPADWAGSRAAVERTLREAGVDPTGQVIRDGSGLSRANRVSPRFLVNVLRLARVQRPAVFASMFTSDALPVAGQTGTLITGFGRYVTKQASCARGLVQAKTGSLFDTTALSGLAHTSSGAERIFSVLVNDRPQRYPALATRQAIDGLTATMTGCWA